MGGVYGHYWDTWFADSGETNIEHIIARTESVWAMLKRTLVWTWHHVSKKHLSRYINEAALRFDEGNCGVDTIDRMAASPIGLGRERLPYQDLAAGKKRAITTL